MKNTVNSVFHLTSFINNKNGSELINYNPQVKKHNTTKLSIIIDDYSNPISVGIYDSTFHDSTIIKNQLNTLYTETPLLFDNNKVLVGDSAYDSKPLENKIKNMNLGTLVRCHNKRRSSKKKKLSLIEKVILNNRIKVEHKFALYKQYC